MPFCAWCGNQVDQVSYAPCPRCGNPSNGTQRTAGGSSDKTAGIIIGVVVGGLVLVAVVGILAAIAIPNLLTAMQRSRQKRTTADIRTVAAAVEGYAVENNRYPDATSVAELASTLEPKYVTKLPTLDAWETPLRYECWPRGECESYAIGSSGSDKTAEQQSLQDYAVGTKTSSFQADIVFVNGSFVQYPDGAQSQ